MTPTKTIFLTDGKMLNLIDSKLINSLRGGVARTKVFCNTILKLG